MSVNSLNKVEIKSILSVWLDVCKAKIDVCINTINKDIYFQVKNNKKSLLFFLSILKQKNVSRNIPFIIESTWDYNTLACLLFSNEWFNINEINPIITKNYVRHTIRWTKTDKTDAKILATIWINERNLFTFNKTKAFIENNKKISLISSLEKQIQSLKRIIKSFNEVRIELELDTSNSILDIEISIKELESNIKNLQYEIEIDSIWKEADHKVKLISSITGISKYMWKVFYSTFAYIDFSSKKSMFVFIWCDPKLRNSGNMIWKASISKRCNPYVRKKLFQAAFMATMHSEYFKKIYDKAKNKWKHHFTCVLCVMKKMIHIIYSLLKNNKKFDPNFAII